MVEGWGVKSSTGSLGVGSPLTSWKKGVLRLNDLCAVHASLSGLQGERFPGVLALGPAGR